MACFRFHRGRSQYAAQDFGLVYRDYAECVRKPFHDFASRAFRESAFTPKQYQDLMPLAPSARIAVALPGTQHLANYPIVRGTRLPCCKTHLLYPQPSENGQSNSSIDQTSKGADSRRLTERECTEAPKANAGSDDRNDDAANNAGDVTPSTTSSGTSSLQKAPRKETQKTAPPTLSEYERTRQANIKKNEDRLKEVQRAFEDLNEDMRSVPAIKKKKPVRHLPAPRCFTSYVAVDRHRQRL